MSNFCDLTSIDCYAGKGGDGASHFRREKYISRGGPDGGNGGNGGNIYLVADSNINTLSEFNTKKIFHAENGGKGGKALMQGKNGQHLYLKTPVGTIVKSFETNEILADLNKPEQTFLLAKGGRGGLGNAFFKSSTNQAPTFAELGEPGEHRKVQLELKLIADIGIIGIPSAGKSTFISVVSNAKPKIADYPFTTLIPNLGVVNLNQYDRHNHHSFIIADIPGLIEGANQGRGLGTEFLRHISRAQLFLHLLDPTQGDIIKNFQIINKEIKKYDPELAKRKQIIALNKIDAITEQEQEKLSTNFLKKFPKLKSNFFKISSVTHQNIPQLIFRIWQEIQINQQKKEKTIHQSKTKYYQVNNTNKKSFIVTLKNTKLNQETQTKQKIFEITGERIEQIIKMTDLTHFEGLERVYHYLNSLGIKQELKRQDAQIGDELHIAGKIIFMR